MWLDLKTDVNPEDIPIRKSCQLPRFNGPIMDSELYTQDSASPKKDFTERWNERLCEVTHQSVLLFGYKKKNFSQKKKARVSPSR
jgi:hypothetical protein